MKQENSQQTSRNLRTKIRHSKNTHRGKKILRSKLDSIIVNSGRRQRQEFSKTGRIWLAPDKSSQILKKSGNRLKKYSPTPEKSNQISVLTRVKIIWVWPRKSGQTPKNLADSQKTLIRRGKIWLGPTKFWVDPLNSSSIHNNLIRFRRNSLECENIWVPRLINPHLTFKNG